MNFGLDKLFHQEPRPQNYQSAHENFPYQHNSNMYNDHNEPVKQTLNPIVTGGSVIALKYKDGIMMCADTLGAYGSMLRYRSLQRIQQVSDTTVVGAGGEYSDFQFVLDLLDKLMTRDYCYEDGFSFQPKSIYHYLSRVMYNRRSQLNPLWNSLIIAGVATGGDVFLGYTDLYGTHYSDDSVATGLGAHLSRPILRNLLDEKKGDTSQITEEEARKTLEKCMTVLYYRDARSINKINMAKITHSGITISEPYSVETNWDFKGF